MDVNDLRAIVTVLSLACFSGIVWWACSRRHAARFDEASRIPFLNDGLAGDHHE
jgi:cytochrome c oxidase cbb3-type subunit IV